MKKDYLLVQNLQLDIDMLLLLLEAVYLFLVELMNFKPSILKLNYFNFILILF